VARCHPEYHLRLPALTSLAGVQAADGYTTTSASLVQQERAAVVRRLAGRLRLALEQVAELGGRIEALAQAQARYAPLTRLYGVSLLTAGSLAGILGPGRRFASEAKLAAYAGVAPLETSSCRSGAPSPQSRGQPAAQCHRVSHRARASPLVT